MSLAVRSIIRSGVALLLGLSTVGALARAQAPAAAFTIEQVKDYPFPTRFSQTVDLARRLEAAGRSW